MFLEGSSGLLLVGGCFFLVSFSSYFACLLPLTPHKLYILYFINHEIRGHFFPAIFHYVCVGEGRHIYDNKTTAHIFVQVSFV